MEQWGWKCYMSQRCLGESSIWEVWVDPLCTSHQHIHSYHPLSAHICTHTEQTHYQTLSHTHSSSHSTTCANKLIFMRYVEMPVHTRTHPTHTLHDTRLIHLFKCHTTQWLTLSTAHLTSKHCFYPTPLLPTRTPRRICAASSTPPAPTRGFPARCAAATVARN